MGTESHVMRAWVLFGLLTFAMPGVGMASPAGTITEEVAGEVERTVRAYQTAMRRRNADAAVGLVVRETFPYFRGIALWALSGGRESLEKLPAMDIVLALGLRRRFEPEALRGVVADGRAVFRLIVTRGRKSERPTPLANGPILRVQAGPTPDTHAVIIQVRGPKPAEVAYLVTREEDAWRIDIPAMMHAASRSLRSRKMSRVRTMMGMEPGEFEALLQPPLAAGPDTDPEFYYWRAELHRQEHEHAAAVADYSRALKGDPDRAAWLVSRAELYLWELDRSDRALADLDRALKLDPSRSRAYLLRAYIYQHRNEHERAIAECNRALLERPDFSQALFVRADSKFQLGRFEDAIRDHDLFLADGSFSIEVLVQRSRANWALGRKQAAIADAERARGEGTSTYYGHHVVRALSHYYAYTGRSLPSVFTMTDICLRKTPEDVECLDARAEAYLRYGQPEKARALNLKLEARDDLPARFRETTLRRKARLAARPNP